MSNRDKIRMIEWLLMAAFFYAAAIVLLKLGVSGPIQTVAWKLGHVTLGGYLGYRIDRAGFRDRITLASPPLLQIRRAIIMFAAMYTLGAGL